MAQVRCGTCGGTGSVAGDDGASATCGTCGGSGYVDDGVAPPPPPPPPVPNTACSSPGCGCSGWREGAVATPNRCGSCGHSKQNHS